MYALKARDKLHKLEKEREKERKKEAQQRTRQQEAHHRGEVAGPTRPSATKREATVRGGGGGGGKGREERRMDAPTEILKKLKCIPYFSFVLAMLT